MFFRTIILIIALLISFLFSYTLLLFFSDAIMDVKYPSYAVKHFLRNYTLHNWPLFKDIYSLAVFMQISIKQNKITLQNCAVLLQFSSVTKLGPCHVYNYFSHM